MAKIKVVCTSTGCIDYAPERYKSLGIDILPVVIYGTGKALKKRGRLLRKWPVHMEIDRRITPEEMMSMGETTRRQASQMRKYYQKRYTEIADRIEQDV